MFEDRFKARRQMIFELRRPPVAAAPRPAKPDVGTLVDKAKSLPDLRFQKVQAIKQAIASGRYNVDERLDALFANLPPELAGLDADLS